MQASGPPRSDAGVGIGMLRGVGRVVTCWIGKYFSIKPETPRSQATGPLTQATGPPRSDAGVGIGILRG